MKCTAVRILPRRSRPRIGFTLIELLVVIAVIGMLATVIMTGVTRGIRRARDMQCTANLHQIYLGALAYAQENHGWMPPAGGTNTLVLYLTPYIGTSSTSRATVWWCPGDSRKTVQSSYGINTLDLTAAQAANGWPLAKILNPVRTVMLADSGGSPNPVWTIRYDGSAAVKDVGVEFRHGDPRSDQSVSAGSATVFRQSRAQMVFYDGHTEGVTVNALSNTNWFGLP